MTAPLHSFAPAATLDELAAFPLNDIGNAMRLILLAGGTVDDLGEVDATDSTLLFLLGSGWVGFNGRYWDREGGDDLARRLAHAVSHKLAGMYELLADKGLTAAKLGEFIRGAGGAGATTSMLRQAQSYLTVKIDAFDRDPYALNCPNGTLKLKAGEGRFAPRLEPHEARDRITRCANAPWIPQASAPVFRRTVAEALPKPEERSFFHQVMGYAATGETYEQMFGVCQGPGRDSKSTILGTCRQALGSYAAAVRPETFLASTVQSGSGPQPDIIALAGDTRLAIVSEPPRGAKFDEGKLKAWTGGDEPYTARDLNSKPITFFPRTKLIWEANSFPVTRGDDDGIWRRIKPVLFRRQVPKDKVDLELAAKLRGAGRYEGELPGVLAWLVEGVGLWLGAGGLKPPASLVQVLENYRRTSSPFGDWLHERCVWGEEAKGAVTGATELYNDFKDWFGAQNPDDKAMSQRAFGTALNDRQVMSGPRDPATDRKTRTPIRLKDEVERMRDRQAEAAAFAPAGGEGDLPGVGDLGGVGAGGPARELAEDWGFE